MGHRTNFNLNNAGTTCDFATEAAVFNQAVVVCAFVVDSVG
jgi:hypothetical protein